MDQMDALTMQNWEHVQVSTYMIEDTLSKLCIVRF